MKLHFLIVPLLLLGCGSKQASGPTRIQLLWPDNKGGYRFQAVELKTLRDTKNITGDAATLQVYRNSVGIRPHTKFQTGTDGVLIPEDFETLQMATVYGHMEKLMELDAKLGFADLLPRPRKVFVEFHLPIEVQGEDGKEKKKSTLNDNALYSPIEDALMIVPFEREGLPISFNAGVLAHEYFHSLFQYSVGVRLKDSEYTKNIDGTFLWQERDLNQCEIRLNQLANYAPKMPSKHMSDDEADAKNKAKYLYLLMRAMNEGLADYWGWLYTQNSRFVEASLPKLAATRAVREETDALPSEEQLMAISRYEDPRALSEAAYCVGTYFSALLRSISAREGSEVTARRLLRRLPELAKLLSSPDSVADLISPDALLEVFFSQEETKDQNRCAMIEKFSSSLKHSKVLKRCETSP